VAGPESSGCVTTGGGGGSTRACFGWLHEARKSKDERRSRGAANLIMAAPVE